MKFCGFLQTSAFPKCFLKGPFRTKIVRCSNPCYFATAVVFSIRTVFLPLFLGPQIQGAPKERRRGRAEKRLSKRVFLESPLLLCPLRFALKTPERSLQTLRRRRRNGLSKTPFGRNPFLRTTPSPLLLARPDKCFIIIIFSGKRRASAKISENLRKSAFGLRLSP